MIGRDGRGSQHDMDVDTIEDAVRQTVEKVSGIRVSDYESSLAAAGVDSLLLLEILSELEQKFEIVLNESVVEEFYSLSRIARVILDALRSVPKS